MVMRFSIVEKIKSDLRKIVRHLFQIISDIILIKSDLVFRRRISNLYYTIFIVYKCRRKGSGAVWGFRSP